MNNSNSQVINGVLIAVGAILMFYSFAVQDVSVYIQIVGLICLMVGAYRASKFWVIHKDDHENDQENKPE
jgi:uncharacterized membrane protein